MDWCRLWRDMPNDPKWRLIARKSGQGIGDVIAVFIHMMTTATDADEPGQLQGWDDEAVGAALDLDGDAVQAIREAMQGRVLDGDRLTGWERRQPKREDNSTDRVRRYREAKRVSETDETQCNAVKRTETQGNAPDKSREDKIRDRTPPTPPSGRATSMPDGWEVPERSRQWAIDKGVPRSRVDDLADAFTLHHRAKGSKFKDWHAAFQTWVTNDRNWSRGKSRDGPVGLDGKPIERVA